MSRYIDADKLKEAIFAKWYTCEEIDETIDQQPTADVVQGWIPIKTRPLTIEERKEFEEECGFELEDEYAVAFECRMPEDGQDILVCNDTYVWEDICEKDTYGFGLENAGDWIGVTAWMPVPDLYRKEEE